VYLGEISFFYFGLLIVSETSKVGYGLEVWPTSEMRKKTHRNP
jgi:hypothetical protein